MEEENINPIEEKAVRLDKLNKIKELGIKAYPENYLNKISTKNVKDDTKTEGLRNVDEIKKEFKNIVRVAGRIMTYRSHGKLAFAQLQDVEGRIQIAFVKDVINVTGLDIEKMDPYKFIEKMLDLGDYIGVEGELFLTQHGELTILVKELTFLGKALNPMPEKFHGVVDEEVILRQRYLETLTDENARKRFKLRSDIIKTIREFMWSEGFMEVETPSLELKPTGAAAKPYFTHNNALDLDLVLRISHELPHKKIIVGGYEKVFEIGKVFRNEGVDPSHLPEHTHFEWYSAYWSYKENMDYVEKLTKNVFTKLNINNVLELKDKDGNVRSVDFGKKWERIDYIELIKKDSGIDIAEITTEKELLKALKEKKIEIEGSDKMSYATLVDYLYKKVSRPKITGPAFLYNYPKALQPLARISDSDNNMVDQFQLVINGWELVKGYSELVDPIDQKQRFIEQEKAAAKGDDEAMQGDNEYIDAMEYGMPPISGVGFGIDRFVTMICAQDNLRDCVFFPLMKPRE